MGKIHELDRIPDQNSAISDLPHGVARLHREPLHCGGVRGKLESRDVAPLPSIFRNGDMRCRQQNARDHRKRNNDALPSPSCTSPRFPDEPEGDALCSNGVVRALVACCPSSGGQAVVRRPPAVEALRQAARARPFLRVLLRSSRGTTTRACCCSRQVLVGASNTFGKVCLGSFRKPTSRPTARSCTRISRTKFERFSTTSAPWRPRCVFSP